MTDKTSRIVNSSFSDMGLKKRVYKERLADLLLLKDLNCVTQSILLMSFSLCVVVMLSACSGTEENNDDNLVATIQELKREDPGPFCSQLVVQNPTLAGKTFTSLIVNNSNVKFKNIEVRVFGTDEHDRWLECATASKQTLSPHQAWKFTVNFSSAVPRYKIFGVRGEQEK